MVNKIVQFIAVEHPLSIFGISGIAVFIIGLIMLSNLLTMTEPLLGFAIFTIAVCLSGVVLILSSFILFALSELRTTILKERWYRS